MNYNEALEYIHSVSWLGSRPGLTRVEYLLDKLGRPEKGLNFIHVAGTNGKGSVCSMLDSVLRRAGYRVGLYTSPYIVRFNERIRFDGADISDSDLAALTARVKTAAEGMQDPPTEFEIITAVAFLYFKMKRCDVVVLEVGMGGRLDATNVIASPLASVITGVALDHTAVLGDTVEKIAAEKAGIIKPGCPVVYGGRDDSAFKVIASRAEALGSPLTRTRCDLIKTSSSDVFGSRFAYRDKTGLFIALPGSYQPENAATVIETVGVLNSRGLKIGDQALRDGLASARWPARFELLSESPLAVFDGSHNIQGVSAAVESIKTVLGGEAVILMGVLADKDYEKMVELLIPVTRGFVTVTPPSPRALPAHDLAAEFSKHGAEGCAAPDTVTGAELAVSLAKRLGLPLVMLGSLYMYAEVKEAFYKALKSLGGAR